MKTHTLFTTLFIICTLIVTQPSFGMEEQHIILPICEAPIIKEISHDRLVRNETIDAIAFNPNKSNNILFASSKKLQSYNVESDKIKEKKLSNNQDTISAFIKKNSNRPKFVGSYFLNYSDKHGSYIACKLSKTITVSDLATHTPLYTIKHASAIKYASFNNDHTKLITVSNANNVKISAIKKPIMVQCEGTSITCNPNILCTSRIIESDASSRPLPLAITTDQFKYAYYFMALINKNDIYSIDTLLKKFDSNSLCQLVIASDYLDIANNNINLTDKLYKTILNKYNSKTSQSYAQQLPFSLQNIIAQNRIKDCINYIDSNQKPIFSIQSPNVNLPAAINWNDKTIAIATGNNIQIWDLNTKQIKYNLIGHTEGIISIAFSPNNKSLATGSKNNTATIWDLNTGQVKYNLVGHTHHINSVIFSPDGNYLATASWDKTIKIWDLNTGHIKYTLAGHTRRIESAVFSSDGNYLATNSWDHTAKIWDLNTGHIKYNLLGYVYYLNSVIFSSDGNYLASTSWDDKVRIWDLNTGHIKYTLAGHTNRIESVIFSSDGNYLATRSWDKTAKIWDLNTGQIKYNLAGHTHYINSVIFSPDGNYLAALSWNNIVKIWTLNTGQLKYTLTEPTHPINAITISPDSKNLITGSKDKTIKIWDLNTGQVKRTLAGKTHYIDSVNFSSDGLKLAARSDNEILKIWNLDDTPKQTFLNKLTIEQADFLTEKVYPVIKQNLIFKIIENSEEHKMWMTFLPEAQQYLKNYIQIAPYQ